MKKFFYLLTRVLVTVLMVVAAFLVGQRLWAHYMDDPWTRDGRVRADIVGVAPDVSGLVSEVHVVDNQHVKRGEVLFTIDRARFELALRQSEAALESAQATLEQAQRTAARYGSLAQAVTKEQIEQASTAESLARANVEKASADRDVAKLNLDRSVVVAPVDGIITNFSLLPGAYVAAGKAVTALIDEDSYYVVGYFEETKLSHVHVGDSARVHLMGSTEDLRGRVVSISAGIVDRERSDSGELLANVNPTFSWVRLAQRIPVRIALDEEFRDLALIAGRTATVTVLTDSPVRENRNRAAQRPRGE